MPKILPVEFQDDINSILHITMPAATPLLVERCKRDGEPYAEAYFGHGLTLRATAREVRVIAEDPTPEVRTALEQSGHSFVIA